MQFSYYKRPHSERFCDVALRVKFYCECDVAKSLRMGPKARQSKREIFAQHSRIRGPGVCLRVSYEVLAQRGADCWHSHGTRLCNLAKQECVHALGGQTSSFVLIGNVTNLLSWRWRWVQKMLFYPKFTDDRSRGRRQWIHSVTWGTCLCPDLATYTVVANAVSSYIYLQLTDMSTVLFCISVERISPSSTSV